MATYEVRCACVLCRQNAMIHTVCGRKAEDHNAASLLRAVPVCQRVTSETLLGNFARYTAKRTSLVYDFLQAAKSATGNMAYIDHSPL